MMALLSQHNQVEFGLASIVFIPYCQIKIFLEDQSMWFVLNLFMLFF